MRSGEGIPKLADHRLEETISMPFYAMEIFVGLIQAVVFAVLTLVFFKLSTEKAHH